MILVFLLLMIFTLFTLWAAYRIARYYGVLKEEKINIKDRIVTEEDKKNIYNNLSLAYYIAAIVIFFLQYIAYIGEKDSFKFAILKALSLIGIGISIRVIQAIKKESLKESLTIVALVSSIPIVLLQSLKYGSVTVWTFPMIIIISSVIFSKKTLLVSATLVSIMTQILIWILHPEVTVIVDKYDYILRITMFIATLLIGLLINKIYLSKIKENNQQIRLQKLNLEITSDFADINEENFDEKINIILSKIGLFLGVDRTCLHLINNENNTMIRSHQWCKEEENMEVVPNKHTYVSVSPWLKSQLQGNKIIYIEDISKISHEARWEREILMLEKVKSLVAAPIEDKGVLQGIIGIDSMSYFENWSEQKIEFINIVSKLLSSGINKIESEKEINFMAYYDPLTKLPNRFLLEDRVNRAIDLEEKHGGIISVISIDIDNFKVVNDTMGQTSGDYVLKKVADDLNDLVKKNGSVSRSSGDEFVIMLNNMKDENEILSLADKLIELFSKPFDVDG